MTTIEGKEARQAPAREAFLAQARSARRTISGRWRDPRLGAGVLLIAVSVAGTSWVVANAGARESVYVATRAIAPGEQLSGAGLAIAEVNLDGHQGAYLPAGTEIGAGLVAIKALGAGELVTRSAVGDAAQLDLRPVPVPVTGPLPAGLAVGGQADLWLVPEAPGPGDSGQAPAQPELLAERLIIREIKEDQGAIGMAGGAAAVQVLVPTSQLPAVLAALAGPGRVAITPVPGGARG